MEQGYSQREAAKISGVAQTKLSRLKKSGAIVPDLPDEKYSAALIDKIRAEYGKPVSADNSPVDAQEAAQATEMPADEQTPAADEITDVVPVIADPLPISTPFPTPRTYEGKDYYGAEDVANIIGVTRRNVLYWHQRGYFTADKRAHDGRYLYEIERVMQLKSVYRSDWNQPAYLAHVEENSLPAQVADFVSDNQSADVPVDGEKKSPVMTTAEKILDNKENNSEADNITSAAEIQPASTLEHVSLEQYIEINKINPWTLDSYGLLENVTKYTNKARKIGKKPTFIKCPFCGSLKMTYYEGNEGIEWRCDCLHGKIKHNDDLLAAQWGLDVTKDRDEIYRRVKEKYPTLGEKHKSIGGYEHVGIFSDKPEETPPPPVDDVTQQIIDDLDLSKGEFEKLSDKDKRCIRDETAQRLSIGAIMNWRHPKMPNSTATPRVIFPLGDANDKPSYNAVMTNTGRQKFEQQNKAKIKWADKSLSAGTKFLFNPAALENRIVFVTEGEFDAASILQAAEWKVGACALGGARLHGDLQKRLSRMKNPPMIIVMLDRDAESQTGQKAAPELVEKLTAMHVPAVAKFFEDFMPADEQRLYVKKDKDGKPVIKIDANEILQRKGDEGLKEILGKIIENAAPELLSLVDKFKADREANTNTVDASPDIPVGQSKQSSHDKELPPDIQKIVDAINNSLTRENVSDFLEKAKKRGHVCPECGNGSGTKGTGLDFKDNPPRVVCHCGFSANALKLFAMKNHLSLTGKDFFTTLRAAADFFKVKYDPKTFEFTPQPAQEQWENIFADYVTDADKPATDNPAVSDFEFNHGKIAPQMWPELIGAKNFLDGLTTEKITAELAQSSKVKRAVALCQFYDFNAVAADNFCNRLMAAKSAAAAQVTDWKNNGGLTAPPDDDVQSLAKFTLSDWKKTVNEVVTQIKRRQKHVARALRNHEISERNQQVQSELDKVAEQRKSRFEELKALPPSPARDAEIVAQIRNACDWKENPMDNSRQIATTAANANLIFSNDPALDGVIGFDEFQQCDVFLKRPPWRKGVRVGDVFADRDAARIRFYLRETYTEFGDVKTVDEAIIKYSDELSFHPVKQYLKSLPKWDGKPRAETIFIDFLGVKDTPFAREITRKWLMAAVARIFFPGCHFQSAIVLKGNQGIGKGYLLERLGGKWYNAISDSVDDSHAVDALQNTWIGEFKEMKSLRKVDINAIKAFIDTSADNRRPAYGKRTARFERHTVFAATTNDEHFLKDVTGNRRFWILECGNERGHYVKGLTDEFISQVWAEVMIWAEALKRFDAKTGEWICDEEQLELSAEMKRQVENVAENFMVDDGLAGEISGYLDQLIPPTVIWELLTPEQRRRFIAEGNLYVSGGLKELEARIKNRQYKKSSIRFDLLELHKFIPESKKQNEYFRECGGTESKSAIVLLGAELRQHVCAAEIANERYGQDKRKPMFRIHEVLANLEGWHLGKRIDRDPVYGCQKKVYYRDSNPDDTDNPAGTPADDEHADAQIEPPAEKSKLDEKLDEFVGDPLLEDPPF